jgi:outer membrane protein
MAAMTAAGQTRQRLTLQEAEEIALRNHPAISAAQFSAEAAEEAPVQAAAARHPIVQASFTGAGAPENTRLAAGAINNPIIYSRAAAGFTASQLLLDFGRTSNLVASSRSRAQAEQERVNATRNDVLLAVDRAYFELLRSQAVLRVAEATVGARQIVVDQVTELQKARLKSGLDVSFASVSLEEARLLVASAKNDVAAANANLSNALGYQQTQSFELAEQPFLVEPLTLSELVERALRNRPDLKASTFEVEAAQRFVQAEKARSYPQVSAIASAGWSPTRAEALRAGFGAVGLNVTLPFLNGGLYRSQQTEAHLRERAARERVKELENRVARDIQVALMNVNTSAERAELTQRLLEQAAQALDLAQARYDLGLSSIVELSQAQLAETSAAIQNTNAKYEYQMNRAVLEYHVGR